MKNTILKTGHVEISLLKKIGIMALAGGILFFLDGNLCLYKNTLGIPCPGCGMTRAYLHLLTLDITGAFYYHPLFILPVIFAFLFLFEKHPRISVIYKSNTFWMLMLVIVLSTYAVRMALLFPDQEPMDFNSESLRSSVLQFLRSI